MNKVPFTLLCAAALPLVAQAPARADAAFFSQDPKVLAALCTKRAEELAGKDTHVLAECGDVWLSLGDRARAEALLEKALTHRNSDGETYRLVGRAWLRQGAKTEALKAFAGTSTAFVGSWDSPKNPMGRASIDMLERGLFKESADLMEQVYALDKKDEDNLLHLASAALKADQLGLAATFLQRTAIASPKSYEVWVEISHMCGDYLLKAKPASH